MGLRPKTADAYRLFHEGTLAFAEMEANGIPIDLDYLTRAQIDVRKKIRRLDEQLREDDVWKLWEKVYKTKANLTSHLQLGDILFKHMGYPITMWTEKGDQPATDEKHLSTIDLPFIKVYLERAKLDKVLNTYLIGIAREVDSDGKLHPVFSLAGGSGKEERGGAKSYRSCIAKGTFIEIVRNLTQRPDVPIEEVKAGDLAVCYDDKLNIVIRKVLWAGKMGRRKVIRLHWSANTRKGHLDLTPEHLVRMKDGTYVRADSIATKDGETLWFGPTDRPGLWKRKALAVSRTRKVKLTKWKYRQRKNLIVNHLVQTGKGKGLPESRMVWEYLHGPIPKDHYVIHKDGNNLNNLPDNLVCLHKSEFYILKYDLDPHYPSKADKKEREEYLKALEESSKPDSEYNPDLNNHFIMRMEELEEEVDVYDLEVEEFNNFIANEICVHNSSQLPNFQNLPIRNKVQGEIIRQCFIPGKGPDGEEWVMGEFDYGKIEVKMATCYTKDPVLLRYEEDERTDMHRDQAIDCYLLDLTGWKKSEYKDARYCAKNKFVFPEFYGSVAFQCAPSLWGAIAEMKLCLPDGTSFYEHLKTKGITTLGHCQPNKTPTKGSFHEHILGVEKRFWEKFSVYHRWKEDWWNSYRKTFGFELHTGFYIEGIYKKNKVINIPFQGSGFHCLLWSIIELIKYLKEHKMKTRMVGQIHDCMILIGPRSEMEELLPIIKWIMTEKIREAWKWIIAPLQVEADLVDEGASWNEKHSIEI